MATPTSARLISLDQPRQKRAKSGAERARAYRQRKKSAGETLPVPAPGPVATPVTPLPPPTVTFRPVTAVTPSRRSAAPVILMVAALGLALVGTVQNGWFAQSMGATPVAGMLFLILGVASDATALVLPSVAARAWQGKRRGAALAGWVVWLATFVFAVVGSVGFASTNIADVTVVRASRETPAVTAAQSALADAMRSRDAECKGGVGRYCREREQAVVDRRQALDLAMQSVAQTADPQTMAATKLVSWVTAGAISPSERLRHAPAHAALPAAATWRPLGYGRAHMKYTDDKAKVDAMHEAHWQIKAAIDELKEGHPVPMALYRAARQLHFLLLDADAES
jgi:hypothetical protein